MMTHDEFVALVEAHVADIWSTPGSDITDSVSFLASFGIDAEHAAHVALVHTDKPLPPGFGPVTERASNFMSGLVLGLWLAREIEAKGLRVEAAHFHETAVSYGRVLQALADREGGELELPLGLIVDDTAMVVVEVEDETVYVRLEEAVGDRRD